MNQHKDYLDSDVWKCEASPTGAHYWIERLVQGLSKGHFYCRWCFDVRKFPVDYTTATAFTRKTNICLDDHRIRRPWDRSLADRKLKRMKEE